MADNEKKPFPVFSFLTSFFMVLIAALAVGIFIALLIINRDKLYIERANDYPRDNTIQIDYTKK